MTNETKVTYLPVSAIKVDTACQARAEMNTDTIDDYAEIMKEDDDVFPPVTVFHDGSDYWLADGFHRYRAAQQAGLRSLTVGIREGSRRDAILHSVGANTTHGLRRTRDDKRRAVSILLEDQEWSEWSNRKIADCCGVDEKLVRTLRSASAAKPQIARKFERNGTLSEMDTSKIGRKDGLEELLSIEPNRDEQPEQGWFAAPETAAADDSTAETTGDEQQSPSEPAASCDEVQLRELMSAWGGASGEVRQQFLCQHRCLAESAGRGRSRSYRP
jgi:ParB-like chromosome segregation protein Spo0J